VKSSYIKSRLLPGVLFISFIFIGTAYAMIRTLPVEDLVAKSEHIVLAQVFSVTVIESDPPTNLITLRTEMKLIQSLKGTWPAQEPIILTTRRYEGRWIEDNVELPPPGTKVVLFLTSYQGGFVPVNGIQGVWPLRGGKLLQMGTGKTLDDIHKIVKSQEMLK
jgi:hypothetical protein